MNDSPSLQDVTSDELLAIDHEVMTPAEHRLVRAKRARKVETLTLAERVALAAQEADATIAAELLAKVPVRRTAAKAAVSPDTHAFVLNEAGVCTTCLLEPTSRQTAMLEDGQAFTHRAKARQPKVAISD